MLIYSLFSCSVLVHLLFALLQNILLLKAATMRFFFWLRCFCLAVFFSHMGNKYFYSSADGVQCNGTIDETVLQKTNLMMAGVDLDLGGVFITTSEGTYHEHVEGPVPSSRKYIALLIKKDLTVDAFYSVDGKLFGNKFKHIDGMKWNKSEIGLKESVRKWPFEHIFADEDGKYYAYESSNGQERCFSLMKNAKKECLEPSWKTGKRLVYDELRRKMNKFSDHKIYSVIACNKYSEVDGLLKVSSKGYKDKFYCKNSSWKYVQLVDKTWAVKRSNCRTIKFNATTQWENFTTNSQESTFSPAVSTLSSHTEDWSTSLFTILPTVTSNVTSSAATASTASTTNNPLVKPLLAKNQGSVVFFGIILGVGVLLAVISAGIIALVLTGKLCAKGRPASAADDAVFESEDLS